MSEIVIGIHAVGAALKHDAQSLTGLWVDRERHDTRLRELIRQARQLAIPVHQSKRAELDELSAGTRHQGVVARRREALRNYRENDLPALLDSVATPLLLVLDGVQDPHNLGACLRSAAAAGVHAVLAPSDRAAGLTPVVRKVASGAAEIVPFIQVVNLARCLRGLQEQGVWLVGAAGEAPTSVYAVDLIGPTAIVMGAEGKGLRRLTRECCDVLAHIPMADGMESLNVSVATGIFLFESVRQRRQVLQRNAAADTIKPC